MNYALTVVAGAACAFLALLSRDLHEQRNTARRIAARTLTRLILMRIAAEVGDDDE